MKIGVLSENKKYVISDKKRGVIVTVTRTSATIDYWRYEEINFDAVEGTRMQLTTTIPRMAGSDFFVDHGGEIIEKSVVIPYGEWIDLEIGFSFNPQTGEYKMLNTFELAEK